MIRAGRTTETAVHTTPAGASVHLTAQTWWVAAGGLNGQAAWWYRHPLWIELNGTRVRLLDQVGMARALLLAVLLVSFMRRIRI